MKKTILTLIFSGVFFTGLYILRSIFYSSVLGFLYILLVLLANKIWQKKDSPEFKFFVKPIVNFLTASFLTLSLYCLLYLPISFLVTEILMITPLIPPWIAIIFLFFVLTLFSMVNWQKKLKVMKTFIFVICFIALNGLFFLEYHSEKKKREYSPKIYKITPNWGIQGQIITINGLNFGPTWKPGGITLGKDFYDNNKMAFINWDENEIIIDQPVPKFFGNSKINVVRFDGAISNSVDFEIRDPDSLK